MHLGLLPVVPINSVKAVKAPTYKGGISYLGSPVQLSGSTHLQ